MHHQKTPCCYIQRIAVVFQFEKQNKQKPHANTKIQNYSILHSPPHENSSVFEYMKCSQVMHQSFSVIRCLSNSIRDQLRV